jgi:hypothetical protein
MEQIHRLLGYMQALGAYFQAPDNRLKPSDHRHAVRAVSEFVQAIDPLVNIDRFGQFPNAIQMRVATILIAEVTPIIAPGGAGSGDESGNELNWPSKSRSSPVPTAAPSANG